MVLVVVVLVVVLVVVIVVVVVVAAAAGSLNSLKFQKKIFNLKNRKKFLLVSFSRNLDCMN